MNFKKIQYKNRDEWLKLRCEGIGGSDAGIIMNVNKYKTYDELLQEKANKNIDEISNGAIERGNKLESIIREQYKIDNPNKKILEVNEMYIHSNYDYIRANLDGEIIDENGEIGILEIKTTTVYNYKQFKENWIDTIPISYLYQILHYFLVTGYSYAILVADIKFKCFETDTYDLQKSIKTYTILKDDFINEINDLKVKEIEFWNKILEYKGE